MNCIYFYPFGTKNHVSQFEYIEQKNFWYDDPKTLFHYDQEPIYHHDQQHISQWLNLNRLKLPRVLANSEHSQIKNRICQQEQILDWYYFYHGFAALDWYRDAEYIWSDQDVTHPYLSFNHVVTGKRAYRMALCARLAEAGVLNKGLVSFHGTATECCDELDNEWCYLSSDDQMRVRRYLLAGQSVPIQLDRQEIGGQLSASFGVHEYRLRQRAFLQLVNETIFYDHKLHLTEKIFQPIVTLRPFVLVGAPGNLAYLRSYGFKTFADWIDESYDDIKDPDQRLDHIVSQVQRICSKPVSELQALLKDMQSTLLFNKRHLFGEFRNIIVDELVDNFDRCMRQWNNGRVNYSLPPHPNLDAVKSLLKS